MQIQYRVSQETIYHLWTRNTVSGHEILSLDTDIVSGHEILSLDTKYRLWTENTVSGHEILSLDTKCSPSVSDTKYVPGHEILSLDRKYCLWTRNTLPLSLTRNTIPGHVSGHEILSLDRKYCLWTRYTVSGHEILSLCLWQVAGRGSGSQFGRVTFFFHARDVHLGRLATGSGYQTVSLGYWQEEWGDAVCARIPPTPLQRGLSAGVMLWSVHPSGQLSALLSLRNGCVGGRRVCVCVCVCVVSPRRCVCEGVCVCVCVCVSVCVWYSRLSC